ncbi:unnamed protein product [Chrysoparadoxa australica]
MSFFEAANGQQWSYNASWGTTRPLSEWNGVSVEGGHIVALTLRRNRLKENGPCRNCSSCLLLLLSTAIGSIPPELGQMCNLITLNFEGNQLSGRVEADPSLSTSGTENCFSCLYLLLYSSAGPIPLELGQLSGLNELSLWYNQLSA